MLMRLQTAPQVEPLSRGELYTHLRLDAEGSPLSHPDDEMLDSLIEAARRHLDGWAGWLGRALITQTWDLVLPRLTSPTTLPLPPLQTVDSVSYVDLDGATQTLDAALYRVVNAGDSSSRIVREHDKTWPTTRTQPDAVMIRFTAGYGDTAADVPAPIRSAMKLMIGSWYMQRETIAIGNAVSEVPMSAHALLDPYRIYTFGERVA